MSTEGNLIPQMPNGVTRNGIDDNILEPQKEQVDLPGFFRSTEMKEDFDRAVKELKL